MANHTHQFVERYAGLLGFGWDRKTDESTLQVYLQKFSDDKLMEKILPRLSGAEMDEVFDLITRLLRHHLSESEYHLLFLKSDS